MRNTKTYRVISTPGLALLALLFFGATTITAAPGDLDPTFGNGGRIPPPSGSQNISWATGIAVQPDQKIVVLGTDNYRVVLTRFLPDGTLDPSFGTGGRVYTDLGATMFSASTDIVLQTDGKIIVTGSGVSGAYALRYLSDGTLDPTFDEDGKVLIRSGITLVSPYTGLSFVTTSCRPAVQSDGRILLGCGEWLWEEDYWNVILRLNSNGSIDMTFGGGIGGPGRVYLDANELDYPYYIALQPNGKIVAASSFNLVGGRSVVLTRLNNDGSVDASFGNSGKVVTSSSEFHLDTRALTLQPDNKMVVAGHYTLQSPPYSTGALVMRYLSDGTLDTSFAGSGMVFLPTASTLNINSIAVQANGKIIAGGFSADQGHLILRFLQNGDLDEAFGNNGQVTTVFPNLGPEGIIGGGISDLAIQGDGKIISAGDWSADSTTDRSPLLWSYSAIARLLGDPTPTPTPTVTPTPTPTPTPTCPNPIDCPDFFVRQQYLDFLNREPDASGLAFWINEITSCGGDQQCTEVKRVNVSAAFFLSIEFQQTGYLAYRIYKAAYGNLPNAPVPIRLGEFLADTRQIGQGVVVLQPGWETVLENNKQAFAAEFVQRSRFTSIYPTSMTPDQFVDQLFTNSGVTPSVTDRTAAINEFGSATTTTDTAARARALRRVAENLTLSRQEFNRAFVLMQYFGYLRRNPNDPPEPGLNFDGYNFWLTKLNQFNGDYISAEMVKAFITSGEYRQRFDP